MSELLIIESGLLTTVQDMGRPGHGSIGVSWSGAADTRSLRIGNRLLGNPDDAAGIEMTVIGATIQVLKDATIVLAGAPALRAEEVAPVARPLQMWRPVHVSAGATLRIGPISSGARTYLCVAGGITTPPVLDSRATHVATGLGITGTACVAGDVLPIGSGHETKRSVSIDSLASSIHTLNRRSLRVVWGPQWALLSEADRSVMESGSWHLTQHCDRMGMQLEGPPLGVTLGAMLTEPVFAGCIQALPSGQLIVLGVDCAPTGGYPVIASVISADLPALGQRRPGDTIRFVIVPCDEARQMYRDAEEQLDRAIPPCTP